MGFEADEGLLPYPAAVVPRLPAADGAVFAFPAKFLFVDLAGLSRAGRAGFGKTMEVVLFLSRTSPTLEQGVDAGTFRTGCTPIVNLFEQTAEPIDAQPGALRVSARAGRGPTDGDGGVFG